MNAKEYREQVAAKLATATPATTFAAPAAPEPPEAAWRAALASLSNPSSTAEKRKEALQLLQAGTFLEPEFNSVRAEYVDALRRSATDPSEDVRRYALGILMTQKDDFARGKLVEGLQGTADPLLPPAAALSLLARDDHASVSTVAAEVLRSSVDPAVRMQAVRVLGRDPDAVGDLDEIVRNKEEFREVRRAGAVALKNLDPGRFLQSATTILNDEDEYRDIKSTVGGALERGGLVLNRLRPGP
jgi:hypothetical protein